MERSPEYAKVLAGLGQYAHEKVERVLKEMLNELFLATPDDPIQFMINFLTEYKRTRGLTSPSSRLQAAPIPSPSRSPAAFAPQQVSPRSNMRAHDRAPSLASLSSLQTTATEEDHNGEANGLPRERSTSSLNHSASAVLPPDHLDSLPVMEVQGRPNSKAYNRNRRRVGVSAEPVDAMQQSGNHTPVVIPKTEEDRAQIRAAVAENILFQGLDDDQMKTVIDAMDRCVYAPGDAVIKQGDDGDHFFVVAKGTADCYVTPKGKPGAQPLLVKQYAYGESFGELALMYNCPRAASIVATSELELWAMDRVTFRRVLMETTSEKRRRYEGFLQQVPLLASLDRYERAKVADALIEITFNDGDCIIAQGDRGNNIYFVKEGTAIATKVLPNSGSQEPQEVMRYGPGSYFGELALLNDLPRAANVIAIGVTKCVYLDRGSFTRLLGPCEEVMKRNTQNYAREEQKVVAQVRARSSSAASASGSGTFSASPSTASVGPNTGLPVLAVSNSMSSTSINATTGLPNVPEEPAGGSRRSTATAPVTPSRSAQSLEAQGGEGGAENSQDGGSGSASAKRPSQSQPAGQGAPPARGRRRAVCAEPVDTHSTAWERVVHPKSEEQAATIRSSIQRNLLFQSLDPEQMSIVVDAMFEKTFAAGDTIIRQGDDGDLFYVLHSGVCECFVKKANVPPLLVKTYQPGETFGELALMYNCPRAATIIAKTPVRVWAMDRVTFHRVLMETTKRKREQYEAFLERVPLLKSLDRYERAKVADALESVSFSAGEYIITEGEVGDCFYILEKGIAVARKKLDGDHNGEEQEVMRYDRAGDWFGELALLHNVPRKANIVAEGPVQCARLDRDSFVRLLGPVEEILKRNKQNYADIERRIAEARRSGVTPAPGLTSSASLSCDLDIDDSAK